MLYAFFGDTGSTDGCSPVAGVIFDRAGNLYGTTSLGGLYVPGCSPGSYGTVFELTPDGSGGWTESILYNFAGGDDGYDPRGGLAIDQSGNLYGTTLHGGTSDTRGCNGWGCGTVFRLRPGVNGQWTERLLRIPKDGQLGYWPSAPLIVDRAGNIFSTTTAGGTDGGGTIFKITPQRGSRMKTRKTTPLRPLLDNELTSYVAAAKGNTSANRKFVAAAIGAITLGSLSLAPPLSAEIIYTPANKSVGNSGLSWLPIDLNNDGIVDLSISAYNFVSFSTGFHERRDLGAFGLQGNQVLVERNYDDAIPAVTGQVIGPSSASARFRFHQDGVMADYLHSTDGVSSFKTSEGLWFGAKNRYLGVKFSINGETHYGWARFNNTDPGYALLTGYAYETEPDKAIPAGVFETAPPESGENSTEDNAGALGALALGAAR